MDNNLILYYKKIGHSDILKSKGLFHSLYFQPFIEMIAYQIIRIFRCIVMGLAKYIILSEIIQNLLSQKLFDSTEIFKCRITKQ